MAGRPRKHDQVPLTLGMDWQAARWWSKTTALGTALGMTRSEVLAAALEAIAPSLESRCSPDQLEQASTLARERTLRMARRAQESDAQREANRKRRNSTRRLAAWEEKARADEERARREREGTPPE